MQLTVIENNIKRMLDYQIGENLLAVLQTGVVIHAPCAGRGTCRKCRVEIEGIGSVLACQTVLTKELVTAAGRNPQHPLVIIVPDVAKAQITTDGFLPELKLAPLIFKGMITLAQPSINDQRSDVQRFEDATGMRIPFHLFRQLPTVLRDSDFSTTFYCRTGLAGEKGEVLRFVTAESPEPLGIAIDIGTTTLAAYLYDLGSGQRLAAASGLNPQSSFGADVISRIDQASQSADTLKALQESISQAISKLAVRLADKATAQAGRKIDVNDICHYVLAGNTTMLHLLAGLQPDAISRSPFIPVSLQTITLTAAELGLAVAPDACCQLLPGISGYVGADITAGILVCSMQTVEASKGKLLIDIGTNGEIVVSGPQGLVACSTAAGPAFEGANIRCGMGGVQGAIDEVIWTGEDLTYTLIGDNGDKPHLARGICGSGLVAAVACLLDSGLIDETGRITDTPEDLPQLLKKRLLKIDSQPAVLIADAAESADGQPIVLTQKDIRELQNAKAAISAGISILIDRAGLQPAQIDQVYIAGGFGNYLDVLHAFRIGMLPPGILGRTRAVGNTSGMGAIMCLLDSANLTRCEELASQVTYYELSGDSRFVDFYVEAMMFPETAD